MCAPLFAYNGSASFRFTPCVGLSRERIVGLALLLGCDYVPGGVCGVGREALVGVREIFLHLFWMGNNRDENGFYFCNEIQEKCIQFKPYSLEGSLADPNPTFELKWIFFLSIFPRKLGHHKAKTRTDFLNHFRCHFWEGQDPGCTLWRYWINESGST